MANKRIDPRLMWAAGVAVVALLALGGWALTSRQAPVSTPESIVDQDMAALGRGIDAINLTTDEGASVTWGALNGKPRAVFFGFTQCPMICPVTIYELTRAMAEIGAPPESLTLDFITVDPERDTPERMHQYLQSFDGETRGLFAEGDTLAQLTRSFEVAYRRQPLEAGGYTMDHTATVFLLDSSGRVVDVLAYGSPPEVIAARLRTLLQLPQPAPTSPRQ